MTGSDVGYARFCAKSTSNIVIMITFFIYIYCFVCCRPLWLRWCALPLAMPPAMTDLLDIWAAHTPLAGHSLDQISVDFLLPTGIYIQMDVPREATIHHIKLVRLACPLNGMSRDQLCFKSISWCWYCNSSTVINYNEVFCLLYCYVIVLYGKKTPQPTAHTLGLGLDTHTITLLFRHYLSPVWTQMTVAVLFHAACKHLHDIICACSKNSKGEGQITDSVWPLKILYSWKLPYQHCGVQNLYFKNYYVLEFLFCWWISTQLFYIWIKSDHYSDSEEVVWNK